MKRAHGFHTLFATADDTGQARSLGDKTAILLSSLCLVHCLVLPLAVSLLPWPAVLVERETAVHRWLLLAIVPISALTLVRGCARHGHWTVLGLGAAALGVLVTATQLDDTAEWMETGLTVLGSAVLSASHLMNLRALRRSRSQLG